jgi:hypothetical protein
MAVSSPARFQASYDAKVFPARAVDELVKQKLTSRIFSTDDWSGYVIYRLYPNVRVFLDGRSGYYELMIGEEFSEGHLKKYGAETVLLPASSTLSIAIKGSDQWRCVYKDDVAVIFRPVKRELRVSTAQSGSWVPGT